MLDLVLGTISVDNKDQLCKKTIKPAKGKTSGSGEQSNRVW